VPGQQFTITVNCRSSIQADYTLILLFDLVGPDGQSVVTGGSLVFDLGYVNRGIATSRCQPGTNVLVTSSLPFFPRTSEVDTIRVRVWLKPSPPGQPGPVPSGNPDSIVSEPVHWTFSR
jgi:hypothetical protein